MGVVSTLVMAPNAATNLVQIGGSVMSLAGATKALVSPQNEVEGIDGLVFDIPETESIQLSAQITDHVVEDNSAMQDHVSISPVKITLTGKVAELVMTKSKLQKYAELALTTLAAIPVIGGTASASAMRAMSEATRAKQAVDSTLAKFKNMSSLLGGEDAGKNKQQKFYSQLEQMFYGRGRFTVQTPWKTFENMVIESVSIEQDESTNTWSTVTVTMKQVRLAQTKTVTGKLKGRIEAQKQPEVKKGAASGKSIAKQLWESAKGFFGG